VEIFLSKKFLHDVVVRHTFGCYPRSGGSVPEELPTHDKF
jgi:hypothetical protein